jgi:serine/threonine protein kinase
MYAHILEGVRYLLEEMRFVHQDIKPDNLLLSDDGYVKVC